MLLANETVAAHLDAQRRADALPHPRGARHPEGGEVRGVHLDASATASARRPTTLRPRHFQKLVERIHGTPEEKPIAFLMLRTMQKARYAPENLGHFGLAATSYTHFTSPIRRYPDLVVHRTLRESRHGAAERRSARGAGRGPAGDRAPHLGEGAARRRCRARAGAVEEGPLHGRQGRRRVRGLHHRRRGVRPVHRARSSTSSKAWCTSRRWPTTTTGSSSARTCCAARTRGKVYRLGDKVKVQVVRVDMERRQVDLGLVEILERVRESERNRGPRREQGRSRSEERRKPARRARNERRQRRPDADATRRTRRARRR